MSNRRIFVAAILVIAALQVAAGIVGVAAVTWFGATAGSVNPPWVFLLQMAVFSTAAGLLIAGARGDSRVEALGVVMLLIAVSFAREPTSYLEPRFGDLPVLVLLRGLRVDAFLPVFAWLFFRDFPRALDSANARRMASIAIWITGIVGAVLVIANLVQVFAAHDSGLLRRLDASYNRSPYWSIVYGLTLPAVPFGLWRARTARVEERRRVALFALGIAAATVPLALLIFTNVASERFTSWIEGDGRVVFLSVFQALVLSIPMTTAYSVLVHRVIPVGQIIRKALQYAVVRGAVAAFPAIPFAWIGWQLYQLRGETLVALLSGPRAIGFGVAGGLGLIAMRVRSQARDVVDRTFFREQYDARRILLSVAERSRDVGRTAELAQLLSTEIDRAFHLEGISVLIADPLTGFYRSAVGSARPLALDATFAEFVGRANRPVDAELGAGSALASLPESDRQWVADSAGELFVPIVSSASELIGLIVLGAKRSELPFSAEDRQLLSAIGAAGAVTLEGRLKLGTSPRSTSAPGSVADVQAAELVAFACAHCGSVYESGSQPCAACSGELVSAPLPILLFEKFRLEQRVGEGSMGVVFRARDLSLDRSVAIKTLPSTTAEEAVSLRREARAMAAVHHANLALIYSAESWKGTPLLITEFLEGGMLEQRMGPALLPMTDALDLGNQLAAGLGHLHRAGILHGDVKPSNIGFTGEGFPKLLDFGLARPVGDQSSFWTGASVEDEPSPRQTRASDQGIMGTPIYMSPEALRGGPPEASLDLWSLALVLFEGMSGHHPLEKDTWFETLRAIRAAAAADIREFLPDCPAPVAEFFHEALAADPRRRPSSAQEFATRWAALRTNET